jgi:hypothetical protein
MATLRHPLFIRLVHLKRRFIVLMWTPMYP